MPPRTCAGVTTFHQVDVVLATVLLADRFTPGERRRIFEYYDP